MRNIVAASLTGLVLLLSACGSEPSLKPGAGPSAVVLKSIAAPTAAASPIESSPTRLPGQFDGNRAYQDVLRQMGFGARPVGSRALQATGDYFLSELQAGGWKAEQQKFEYRSYPVRNILAQRGQGRLIIIGAHYDARLKADQDPQHPEQVVPAANDGASGAAVLLELGRVLVPDKLHNTVMLAFFDAEDDGELDLCRPSDANCDHTPWPWSVGSDYVASHLQTNPEAVVVIDMIGDRNQDIYYEQNSNKALQQQIWAVAQRLGYGDQFIAKFKYGMEDDHTPFLRRGMTAVDIIDFDYPYYHTTQDTADKVAPESLERVGRVLQTWLQEK